MTLNSEWVKQHIWVVQSCLWWRQQRELSLSKYWFINLMDMSQCYAGSRLLYFSLDLNSRKSLFGPLVNLGMPKRPISLLLAWGLSVFQLASFPCSFSPASRSHCCFVNFLSWNMMFGVHLVILHVHQQVLLPQLSVSVLRLHRCLGIAHTNRAGQWCLMRGAGASNWDLELHLSIPLRNGVRVGKKCTARSVSSLGLKLSGKSCSRYLEFLICVPNFLGWHAPVGVHC